METKNAVLEKYEKKLDVLISVSVASLICSVAAFVFSYFALFAK